MFTTSLEDGDIDPREMHEVLMSSMRVAQSQIFQDNTRYFVMLALHCASRCGRCYLQGVHILFSKYFDRRWLDKIRSLTPRRRFRKSIASSCRVHR